MTPKIRNIIIIVAALVILVLIYFFFFSSPTPQNLVTSSDTLPNATGTSPSVTTGTGVPATAGDFLTLLLNVQNLKLNDAIFSDPAFKNLHDSSIMLIPDNTQGRPNPFAQFGNDIPSAPYIPNIPSTPSVPAPTTPTPAAPVVPPAPVTPAAPAPTNPTTPKTTTPAPTTTKPAPTKP